MTGQRLLPYALTLLVVAALQTPAPSANHPFHSSLAEVEWNSKSRAFEVALSVWPVDLEQVLRRSAELKQQLKGPLSIDDQSQHALLEAPIRDYVRGKFKAQLGSETQLELAWLGFEVERDSVWCYFELKVPKESTTLDELEPGETASVQLDNQLFFELQPDQQNTILFRQAGKRQAIHFDERQPRQSLKWLPNSSPAK